MGGRYSCRAGLATAGRSRRRETSELADILAARVAAAVASRGDPLVVGLTGGQGSGKTTLARALTDLLRPRGVRAATLALDDLYLPKAERARLAAEAHPLLATRGVPGTHDVALGRRVLESLRAGGLTNVPRFDKSLDDRLPADQWAVVRGPLDVILFEGWCVGARPQPAEALAEPVNALERDEDPDAIWRTYANAQLAGPYADLFAPIGFQALLLASDFATILRWRRQQEHELIERTGRGQSDADLARFVQHYERLTRWIAREMPGRADMTVRLGPRREVLSITPDGPPGRHP